MRSQACADGPSFSVSCLSGSSSQVRLVFRGQQRRGHHPRGHALCQGASPEGNRGQAVSSLREAFPLIQPGCVSPGGLGQQLGAGAERRHQRGAADPDGEDRRHGSSHPVGPGQQPLQRSSSWGSNGTCVCVCVRAGLQDDRLTLVQSGSSSPCLDLRFVPERRRRSGPARG